MNRNLIISSDDNFTISKVIINEYILNHNYDLINIPKIRSKEYYVTQNDMCKPNNIGGQYFVKISFLKNDDCNVITFNLFGENNALIDINDNRNEYIDNFHKDGECIIRETDYFNFYYNIKENKLVPYFNVKQHATEVKFKLNKIINILGRVKTIIFEMGKYNFPIMQMYAINPDPPNELYKIPCKRYNVLFSVSGNLYPTFVSSDPKTDIINKLNEYIYENFPICIFPKYSPNKNKIIDSTTGDRYFNINLSSDNNVLINHSQFYFSIQKLVNTLKELKKYTKLGLFNETVDDDIDMFNKYLSPFSINNKLHHILYNGKLKFDTSTTKLTTDIDDRNNNKYYIVEYYNEGIVKFIVDTNTRINFDVFTFEILHILVENVKDGTKQINVLLDKLKNSVYLLNNIHDNPKLITKNFMLPSDENIKKITKSNINKINYYAYCFYIFKNMLKYPLLSFEKSITIAESLQKLSIHNKLKLISMLLMALEGLVVLHKDRSYVLNNVSKVNEIINSSYFKNNHEINLMEQINGLTTLHKLIKIGYHGSIIGKHNIYNQKLQLTNEQNPAKINTPSIHQILQRNYITNPDDNYFSVLKLDNGTSINIRLLNNELNRQDNLESIIIQLIDVYDKFNISDVIKKRIEEYKIEYSYITPILTLN